MKIGIKYCGGCNPRYERKKIGQKIQEELKNYHFELAQDETTYDGLLVLSGCTNNCANIKNIKTKNLPVCVTGKDDYDQALKSLKKIKR